MAWISPRLPVAVVLALALRCAAPYVAAHLPAGGPLALRDYTVLGRVRHPLAVSVWSALLGAATHQLWDAVTHPGVLLRGAETRIAALHATAFAGLPWWRVCQLASESLGAIAALALLVHIGRLRLLRRWHGDPPDVPRHPLRFWATATVAFAVLVAALPALPGNEVGHWSWPPASSPPPPWPASPPRSSRDGLKNRAQPPLITSIAFPND